MLTSRIIRDRSDIAVGLEAENNPMVDPHRSKENRQEKRMPLEPTGDDLSYLIIIVVQKQSGNRSVSWLGWMSMARLPAANRKPLVAWFHRKHRDAPNALVP